MPGISVSFLRKAPHDPRRVGDHARAIELEVIGGQREVGAILLQQVQQPMRKFDVAIALRLGLPKRLDEGLVADAIELAGDRFDADVRAHGNLPFQECAAALAPRRLIK